MKKERDDNYGHVLKYTSIFGGVQGLNILMNLVRNKIVALLLGPEGMGLVSLFQTTVNFISQSTNLGVSFSAVRHVSELFDSGDEARISHFIKIVRAWSLLTGLVGMLLCIVIGPMLSNMTFSWGNHTLHFILLSPLVALLAITGGETAILKGARQLKSLAVIQVYSVLSALIITVPFYYFFGLSGIVPVLVLMGLATLLLTIHCSYRLYPLHLSGAKGILGEGMGMVRLGVAFTLAGVMGSGTEFIIRSYLNNVAGLEVVGIYNAGYMITITYASMVFSAMDSDFFPRLSSVNHDIEATNYTVNCQMEVSLLIIAPMLTALIALLPILIPSLFTSEFLPVVPMAQVATLAMFFKVLTLPVAYITLARGYSMSYLGLETAYFIVFVLLIVFGYQKWGLLGTGIAIVLAHVFDYAMINLYAYKKYGYRMSVTVSRYALILLALGFLAYACTILLDGIVYWVVEFLTVLASALCSYILMSRKT